MKQIPISKYEARTTRPAANNPYYLSNDFGGLNPCIYGKPLYAKGSCLANCVGYCYGRMWEICGEEVHIGTKKGLNYPQSANYWYGYSTSFERGSAARVGAVACWKTSDGRSGHVAMVEKVYSDGSWLASESGYDAYVWRLNKYNAKSYKAGYVFQGFIYCPAIVDDPEPAEDEPQIGDKVKIIGRGNSNANGTGGIAYGIGWQRQIMKIYEGKPYPYMVGNGKVATGFYKKEALKKM